MKTAIVLAGGLGTRLHTVTHDLLPKPMVMVKNQPFLSWILQYLKSQSIQKIILAVSHHSEKIIDHFGYDYDDLCLDYSVESTPLGTGGAVKQAWLLTKEDTVYIINGDTYFPIDLYHMADRHVKSGHDITIGLKSMKNFDRYGAVEVDAKNNITSFGEKKWMSQGYINGGTYIMNREVLSTFKVGFKFSLEQEVFEKNNHRISIGGFKSRVGFIDIGVPEDYQKIQSFKFK